MAIIRGEALQMTHQGFIRVAQVDICCLSQLLPDYLGLSALDVVFLSLHLMNLPFLSFTPVPRTSFFDFETDTKGYVWEHSSTLDGSGATHAGAQSSQLPTETSPYGSNVCVFTISFYFRR